MVIVEADELGHLTVTVIMFLITREGPGNRRMDRLLEEAAIAHPNHLAKIDMVAFVDEDFRFGATGIPSGQKNIIGDV